MGHVKHEDVRGYQIGGQIICPDCFDDKDLGNLTENEILTEKDIDEDDFWFCDRCGKQI